MSGSVKNKKPTQSWLKCDKCQANINQKETEHHSLYCPPSLEDFQHSFVLDGNFYGYLNVKTNEEIKGVTNHDKNNLIYLSQSVIQLLGLIIGDWALIKSISNGRRFVRTVWPMTEKSLSSILITQRDLELNWNGNVNAKVCVSRFDPVSAPPAKEIVLATVNTSKSLPFSPELTLRLKKLNSNRIVTVDNKINQFFYGKDLEFQIVEIVPKLEDRFTRLKLEESENGAVFYKINNATTFTLFGSKAEAKSAKRRRIEDIGGYGEEVAEVRRSVDLALGRTARVEGMRCAKGILLYGASGTGKTMIAKAICDNSRCHVETLLASDVYCRSSSEIEGYIKETFQAALENTPSIIFIDEIDLLCPVRTSRISDVEKRVVAAVLNGFDAATESDDSRICIIGTSSRTDGIDPAFRRSGRLDREVEMPIPNPRARFEILGRLLEGARQAVGVEAVKDVAGKAYGFVAADLEALCTFAASRAAGRGDGCIQEEDLRTGLARVRPSAMREVQIEVPNVRWADIGGQDDLKLALRQAVEWPLKHPESFVRMGITPPRGVLMFGPPGCSKTMIAKALATESGLNFISIKGPELFNKWVGESERAVRDVFRKARQVAPSVVFFDEIDALGSERSSSSSASVQERVLAQLLTELDGVTPLGEVTVLAATNRPDRIDKALLRPGRLDRIVYVPLPDPTTREEIFKIKLSKMPTCHDVSIPELVRRTDGYSGAEIQAVCHEAAMKALEIDINAKQVDLVHFESALTIITPRTPDKLLKIYKEYVS